MPVCVCVCVCVCTEREIHTLGMSWHTFHTDGEFSPLSSLLCSWSKERQRCCGKEKMEARLHGQKYADTWALKSNVIAERLISTAVDVGLLPEQLQLFWGKNIARLFILFYFFLNWLWGFVPIFRNVNGVRHCCCVMIPESQLTSGASVLWYLSVWTKRCIN